MEIRCSVRSCRRHSTECVWNHTLTQLFGITSFMNEEPRIAIHRHKGTSTQNSEPTEFDRRKDILTHAHTICMVWSYERNTRNKRAHYASTHTHTVSLFVSYVVNSILSVVRSSAHRLSVLEIDVVIAAASNPYTYPRYGIICVSMVMCVCDCFP